MNIILIGVNYNSSKYVEQYLDEWSKIAKIKEIYVVDNFYSDQERIMVEKLCNEYRANLLVSDNVGYGASLNYGIKVALNNNRENDLLFMFGNIDILPRVINIGKIDHHFVPELSIIEDGKNRNPFLNKWQSIFLFLPCIAAKLKSLKLLYLWLIMQKILKHIPGKTHSVHGSLFAVTRKQMEKMGTIFDERVFMYCEELFFSKKVRKMSLEFKKIDIEVEHIGSVSTSMFKNKEWLFENWTKSMMYYCEK